MQNIQTEFTLTAFFVLAGVMASGLLLIFYFQKKELRRKQKEAEKVFPSAKKLPKHLIQKLKLKPNEN